MSNTIEKQQSSRCEIVKTVHFHPPVNCCETSKQKRQRELPSMYSARRTLRVRSFVQPLHYPVIKFQGINFVAIQLCSFKSTCLAALTIHPCRRHPFACRQEPTSWSQVRWI